MAESTPNSSIEVAICAREGGIDLYVHAVDDRWEGTVDVESSVGLDGIDICDRARCGGVGSRV
jgi:hypothetical protein